MIADSWTSTRRANTLSDTAPPRVRIFREHDLTPAEPIFCPLADTLCVLSFWRGSVAFLVANPLHYRLRKAVSIQLIRSLPVPRTAAVRHELPAPSPSARPALKLMLCAVL